MYLDKSQLLGQTATILHKDKGEQGMKAKTLFYCTDCGNELPKWAGQCPACRAWNTIVEQPAEMPASGPRR